MQQPDTEKLPAPRDFALYDQHAPTILVYLCQHITNAQDAEDLLVEVFLAALTKPDLSYLPVEHQLAWLRRVAQNKLVDRLRKMTRLTLTSLDEALEQESCALTPEQQSIRQENYTHLYRCLARLAPEQQELIQLRYGEGLRLVEIAAHLRKPDGTVRKQLLRTLKRLRMLYDQSAQREE